jgi:outer membrane receptor protein involved in Fe transport
VPDADAACVPWDVFAIGQVTPQATAYLSIPPSMSGSFKQQVANVNATIQLDAWGIGSPWTDEAAALNMGAEFRKDTVEFDPDNFAQTNDIAGFGEQVFHIHGSIHTKEVFAEARVPLVSDKLVYRLALEGGFRRSWYHNLRGGFSSNTYKLGLDLTAIRGLHVRASQQRANRAPNVQELFAPSQTDSFLRDPCAGPIPLASQPQCALTGVAPEQYGQIAKANGLFEYNAIRGGNEDLEAEAATTRAVGIVLQPQLLPRFNASVDWWGIKLKSAISRIGAQAIVDNCIASGDPIFCDRIHRDSNGSLWLGSGYVDNRQANLGSLKVSGIDGSFDYSWPSGRLGSASFEFRGSYVLKWIVDNGGLSMVYDCAGLFGTPCGMQPRWKHTARAIWNLSRAISLSLQWRRVGGAKLAALNPKFNLTDQVSPGHSKLKAQDYFDIATVLRPRKALELRLGVNNVLDRQPPLIVSNTAAGDGPYNANTYPEWYDPLGRYVFASVTVAFKP